MGKYQKLKGKVPRFEENPPYQQKIDAWKEEFLGTLDADHANVAFLAGSFASYRKLKDEYEDKLSEVTVYLTALDQLIRDLMEAQSLQKVELADGGLLYLQDSVYPTVEDKVKWDKWIDKNKMGNLRTIPWQTTKGIVSEMLVNGKPAPPGIKAFLKTQVRVRGLNSKENSKEEV